jgi:hypothetical protein
MPHWEDELRSLLKSLGVVLDDSTMPLTRNAGAVAHAGGALPLESDDADDEHFAIIQREMEATVREVARLARTGKMEAVLRDDVIYVLRALTRPAPANATDFDEWRYASAAAVLHFCRLVLRLAQSLA